MEETNKLQVLVQESGLDSTKAKFLLEKFQNYFEIAAEWEAKAKAIVVTREDQTAEMEMAKVGRLYLREKRLHIERSRKELKEQSLREGKAIDGIANVLKALIVPIEEHLDRQEKFVEYRQREEEERIRKEAEARAEAERIEKERAEAEERERIRVENERLREENARAERERRAAEEKAEKERRAREKAEADRQSAEDRAASDRRAREKAETEKSEMQANIDRRRLEDEEAALMKRDDEVQVQGSLLDIIDEVQVRDHEVTCPKCGTKIKVKG